MRTGSSRADRTGLVYTCGHSVLDTPLDYRIPLFSRDLGSEARQGLTAAFDSLGPETGGQVESFERGMADYLGGGVHVVATSSGTAALHVALLIAGVAEGDEVLCPTLTAVRTADAIRHTGARPVLVDAEPRTWNVDPDLLVSELHRLAEQDRLPGAVVTADLYGQCADHEPVMEAARALGVPVIEDASEALGATYHGRPAGTLADLGVFSFAGEHILTTSTGGMIVPHEESQARRAREIASELEFGMSDLLAGLGRSQLTTLNGTIDRCRAIHGAYRERLGHLEGLSFQEELPHSRSTRWLTCLTFDAAEAPTTANTVGEKLARAGIETRRLWKPLHLLEAYADCRNVGKDTSAALFRKGLCLPSGPSLREKDAAEVATMMDRALTEGSPS